MGAEIRIDTSSLRRGLAKARVQIKDWTPALAEWGRGTGADIRAAWADKSFAALFPGGRTFRELSHWKGVARQYTRRDGTVVPPWGGNAKVRGRGSVQGRKRPSGARVKAHDIVGQDLGNMMKEFTTRYLVSADKRSVKLYTVVKYGVHQNNLRRFNKLGDRDRERLVVAAQRQWNKAAQAVK